MVRTKVFVGNLSFKTQESDLAKEFEVAGKVATANIISRGSRSLGYGFVEFESEEEARKAVELLNKKLIDSREINVEVARPRDENAPREPSAPRPPRAPRAPRGPRQDNNNNNNAAGGEGEGAAEGGQRRRPPPRRPRIRRPRNVDGAPAGEGAPKEGGAPAPRVRRPRQPRQPKPEGERVPRIASANTLFVANLPFSVDDTGLAEIFAGLNLKSAHVVRKRNNRSKGFGFVEFNNTEDQTKALAAVDKKSVQERELIVKVALTEVVPAAGEQQKDATPKKEAPVAAASSPKPAAAASPKPAASPKTN